MLLLLFQAVWDGNCIYWNNKLSINPRMPAVSSTVSPLKQQRSELTAGLETSTKPKWNQAEAAD